MDGGGSEVSQSLNEWEMVAVPDKKHDMSIFPPDNHEGLQIPPTPRPDDDEVSESADTTAEVENERGRLLNLRTGIVRVANRVRCFFVLRGGFWSFGVAMAAAVLYCRVRRWRHLLRKKTDNRLLHLIKESDQKMNQLLLRIAQMNEMLSARRRVAVVRIG